MYYTFSLYLRELQTSALLSEWLNRQYGDTMRRHVAMGEILAMKQKHEEGVSSFTTCLLTSWQDSHGTHWKVSDTKAEAIFSRILFTNRKSHLLKISHPISNQTQLKIVYRK